MKIRSEIRLTRTLDMVLEAELKVPDDIGKKAEAGDTEALQEWLEANPHVWENHQELVCENQDDEINEVIVN